jgi:hypothetical protein
MIADTENIDAQIEEAYDRGFQDGLKAASDDLLSAHPPEPSETTGLWEPTQLEHLIGAISDVMEKHAYECECYECGRTRRLLAALTAPAPDGGLREAVRSRIRLYDSQVDVDCIGTGYDITDIITLSELEQLVGFTRPSTPAKETT